MCRDTQTSSAVPVQYVTVVFPKVWWHLVSPFSYSYKCVGKYLMENTNSYWISKMGNSSIPALTETYFSWTPNHYYHIELNINILKGLTSTTITLCPQASLVSSITVRYISYSNSIISNIPGPHSVCVCGTLTGTNDSTRHL